ncbi:MAG: hypothetical protein JWM86_523, partial [Thermoleophilia bacterium]|nr:hypothetical protein [Thermoleophilia bacterium]
MVSPATPFPPSTRVARALVLAAAILLGVLFAPMNAVAAPPANDNFANAQVMSGTSVVAVGTNGQATTEPGEIQLYTDYDPAQSVWYSWTATYTGNATVAAASSDVTATVQYEVGTGSPVTPVTWSSITSSYNGGPRTFAVTSGTTYYIGIDRYGTSTVAMPFKLHINHPLNDDFADSVNLTSPAVHRDASNVYSSSEIGEPAHAGITNESSIWYHFTPTVSGTYWVDTLEATPGTLNTVVAVYTGISVNTLTPVASNDDWPGWLRSRLSFTASAGTTYKIAVTGRGGTTQNGFQVRLGGAPSANDKFASATVVSGTQFVMAGNSDMDTPEVGEYANYYGSSEWFTWTAPASGQLLLRVTGTQSYPYIYVFTGTTETALTTVTNTEYNRCGSAETIRMYDVVAGTTYRFRSHISNGSGVSNSPAIRPAWGDYTVTGTLNGPAPANDALAGATTLTGASTSICGDNFHASAEAGEPAHAGTVANESVWYTWTAPSSGVAHLDTDSQNYSAVALDDTVLGVYTG